MSFLFFILFVVVVIVLWSAIGSWKKLSMGDIVFSILCSILGYPIAWALYIAFKCYFGW